MFHGCEGWGFSPIPSGELSMPTGRALDIEEKDKRKLSVWAWQTSGECKGVATN